MHFIMESPEEIREILKKVQYHSDAREQILDDEKNDGETRIDIEQRSNIDMFGEFKKKLRKYGVDMNWVRLQKLQAIEELEKQREFVPLKDPSASEKPRELKSLEQFAHLKLSKKPELIKKFNV